MATREPQAFGELLRRHRLAAGLTQEALAEQAGLSARGIADLERGARRFPYPTTVKRLAASLGLTSEELATLAIASERARPDQDPPLEQPKPTLPITPTSFVGRDHELAEVQGLLSASRVLTLAGPGGVGKTRLALALAQEVAREYRDGVWFVDLGPLVDGSLVAKSVAAALGIRERPGQPLTEIVCEVLAERSLLLVIDNCEHVLAACVTLVEGLLRQCASVRLLLTSREPLRISGETLWRVPSLRVPDRRARVAAETLINFGATRLFVERAWAVEPRLVLHERQAVAIAHICQRLDGLPLAIELAAARVSMFSVEQIAGHLDQSFRLLSNGSRSAPPRQQTLRATIDWSYGLLPEADKLLLDRLSTFAGGWTFEAAESVASGDVIHREDMLGLLGGLVDRSLVVAEPSDDGQVRYRLLDVLHQYGQERLVERGQADATRRQHAAYFLGLAEEAEPAILGPDRRMWLDRLEAELDNFRAARRWFVGTDDGAGAVRLASALYRMWMYRGYINEGRASLAEGQSLPGVSPAERAKALFCDGGLGVLQADYASGQRHLEEALALWRELGDTVGTAWALMGVGACSTNRGDYELATEMLAEACRLSRSIGDQAVLGMSLAFSADLAYAVGDFEAARQSAEEAIQTADAIGFATPACIGLSTLGAIHYRAGSTTVAEELLQTALVRGEALDEAYAIVRAAIGLALLVADAGDMQRARTLLLRSVLLAQRVGNRQHVAQALEGLAAFAALNGEARAAMRLTGAASAVRTVIGAPLSPTERQALDGRLDDAYQLPDADEAAVALRQGESWTIEQATAFALEFALARDEHAPPSITESRTAGLTRRELEVAMLVARGLTNRQVAEELVINEKTAKNHVQRVLEKLGVNSRSQIIARAQEFSLAK